MGISVDSFAANKRFAQDLGVTFPLLSDFHRKVSKEYGIYLEKYGVASRATFVVDKQGIIKHIEQGGAAIDPAGAFDACSYMAKKK